MEAIKVILELIFTTWIGGVWVGGAGVSAYVQNPWDWRGAESIASKALACLFWPVWVVIKLVKFFFGKAPKVAPAFGMFLLYSALGGGLWIIPALLFIFGGWSFYRANQQSKSGTKHYDYYLDADGNKRRKIRFSDKHFPIIKTGAFWFGVALVTASIVTLWMMLAEK